MSAFICDERLFRELALFATMGDGRKALPVEAAWLRDRLRKHGIVAGSDSANTVASVLLAENLRSVRHRYPKVDQLPGPIPTPEKIRIEPGQYAPTITDPVQILKFLDCLEYQSCETKDYEQSFAYELLGVLRKAAIRRLDGYDAAMWDA